MWVDAVGVMFVTVRAATRQNGDTIAQIYNLYIIIEPIYEALFEINESHLEQELGLVKLCYLLHCWLECLGACTAWYKNLDLEIATGELLGDCT